MDFAGRCRGQIKVSIKPLTDVKNAPNLPPVVRRESTSNESFAANPEKAVYRVASEYGRFPSHLVQHTEQIILSPEPTFLVEESRKLAATPEGVLAPGVVPMANQNEHKGGGSTRGIYWNPPKPQALPEETVTKSILQTKLSDLDVAMEPLKRRLQQNSLRLAAGTSSSFDKRNNMTTGEQVVAGLSELTLEQLQEAIETQLRLMGREAPLEPTPSNTENSSNDPPCNANANTAETSSAEILCDDVLLGTDDEADLSGSRVDALLNLNPSRSETSHQNLHEISQIDWGRVLNEGTRNTPEGGNPKDNNEQNGEE